MGGSSPFKQADIPSQVNISQAPAETSAELDPMSQQLHSMLLSVQEERTSGYPQPQLYDQYFINKYAYPKGLKTCRRDGEQKVKQSLYDRQAPNNRKGFSGWKLTLTKKQEESLLPEISN